MPKRHFISFDALRFFAFLKVFLLHLPITAFPVFNFLKAGGGIGVQFFFVLSGFLITYIIYEEKLRQGQLNLKKFYIRRLLRIWPLYYLAVLISYLTPWLAATLGLQVSADGYAPDPWFSFTFLENYKMILTGQHPNVSPLTVLWSLCIEEHFYLVWGVLLYFCRLERLPYLLAAAILLANSSKIIFLSNHLPTLDLLTNLDLFAYGAIPAYFLLQRPERFEKRVAAFGFIQKLLFVTVLLAVVVVAPHVQFRFAEVLTTAVLGLLFSGLLFLIVPGQRPFRIPESNLLSRLGVYTFGLYVYHTVVIGVLLVVFRKLNWSVDEPVYAVLFGITTLTVTAGISVVSFYLFEAPFLRLKKYFY